jgi:hypothetical protein
MGMYDELVDYSSDPLDERDIISNQNIIRVN